MKCEDAILEEGRHYPGLISKTHDIKSLCRPILKALSKADNEV